MLEEETREDKERALYNTTEQERILLKCLFTQLITAKKYFSKTKEEIFTNANRLWLFQNARDIFRDTGNLFSEGVINSELDRVKKVSIDIDMGRKIVTKSISHTDVMAEWNMICGSEIATHTPEWLISDLETKRRARNFMDAAEKAVDRVLKGESDEAITDLNSDLIRIRANVNRAKPLRDLGDPSWQIEIIEQKQENPHLYSVLRTGLPTFDNLAGLYRGELTLITAHTGVGKSTLMRSMAKGAREAGLNVLYIVNEEVEEQAGAKFASMECGFNFPYKAIKTADETVFNEEGKEEFKRILKEKSESCGKVWIQELPQFHTCADIEEIIVELQQQGSRVDVVMLDYFDHLKPMEKSWSETDEQNKAIAEFKSICMQFRVAGVTATQADTQSVELDDMSSYNVRGSKQKSGAANIVLAIKELIPDDGDDEPATRKAVTWRIIITKNRDGAKCNFLARFHKTTGVVKEMDSCSPEEKAAIERDAAHSGKKGKKKKRSEGKSASDAKDDGVLSAKTSSKTLPENPEEEAKSIAEITDEQDDFNEEDMVKPSKSSDKPKIERKASTDKKKIVRRAI
jgi:replicative DNA helicase